MGATRSSVALLALTVGFLTSSAWATPLNTANIDGVLNEYDGTDLVGTYTGPQDFGPDDIITNLFVTWDEDNLYIALQGHSFSSANRKFVVMLDVDADAGTGASTTTNWTGTGEGFIDYNDVGWVAGTNSQFGLDYMAVSDGGVSTLLRVLYDGVQVPVPNTDVERVFDSFDGTATGGVQMGAREQSGSICLLQGFEATIPWTTLFNTNRFGEVGIGQVIPTNATLRVFANLHDNSNTAPPTSARDAIPEQVSAGSSFSGGILTTEDYIDIPVDMNGDGLPDASSGDNNAPYIRQANGADAGTRVFLSYNEPIVGPVVTNVANYTVAGLAPTNVEQLANQVVRLDLAGSLPAGGTEVLVTSSNITDGSANHKATEACLVVGSGGISNDVTVTFVLETDSGMGMGLTGYHLNSDAFPLQEDFPAATNTPLSLVGGSQYSVEVTFPAGAPQNVGYRYSAILNGTNNYEAVRLANYEFTRRWLELNDSGTSMVVSDYLGTAASPARSGETGYNALYVDTRRGDAGVRSRQTILFQLDMAGRNTSDVSRLIVQGSDPLRGFNVSGPGISDFAESSGVGWDVGGIELFDDGPGGGHGDLVAGDEIHSREWSFTPTGRDPLIENGSPNSLVGGQETAGPTQGTLPYEGAWVDRRSPRSVIYKFYAVNGNSMVGFDSPSQDIEIYLHDEANVVLDPHIWDNAGLPLLTSTNPAVLLDLQTTPGGMQVVYTNIVLASDNAIEVAETPGAPWAGYGQRGVGSSGIFTALVAGATNETEVYRVVTPGPAEGIAWWEPSWLPPAGGTVRVWYNQNQRGLAGGRMPLWFGANPDPGPFLEEPMTFVGQGLWYIDLVVAPTSNVNVKFVFTDQGRSAYDKEGDKDYYIKVGHRATWSPERPAPGDILTIDYDASSGPLAGRTDVNIWYGIDGYEDEGGMWQGVAMSSVVSNQWQAMIPVPSTAREAVSWVFNAGPNPENTSGKDWDSPGDWHAFILMP